MHTTHLRKVGGSVMLAVPPAVLDVLNLRAGTTVELAVEDGRMVIGAKRRRYTLRELLEQCGATADASPQDREWTTSAAVGRELL
ncbi:MAG: antitoxin [Desulfovibrio sp.]|jgi:antitoxin ChpS|nr:antitoxin [Desulfovibrio sp.]